MNIITFYYNQPNLKDVLMATDDETKRIRAQLENGTGFKGTASWGEPEDRTIINYEKVSRVTIKKETNGLS